MKPIFSVLFIKSRTPPARPVRRPPPPPPPPLPRPVLLSWCALPVGRGQDEEGPDGTGQVRIGQVRAKQGKGAREVRTGQVRAEQGTGAKAGQNREGQSEAGQAVHGRSE